MGGGDAGSLGGAVPSEPFTIKFSGRTTRAAERREAIIPVVGGFAAVAPAMRCGGAKGNLRGKERVGVRNG